MAHEALLWAWLKKQSTGYARTLDMQRIENGLSRGTPDVEGYYQVHDRNFQLELKAEDRPKRGTTPLRLPMRIEQVRWLARRWNMGGLCWVYVRVGLASGSRRYLVRGCDAERLMEPIHEGELAVVLSVLPGEHSFADLLGAMCRRAPLNG